MEFAPSDRVADLLERVRDFTEEHIDPVESEAFEALDNEVGPGVAYPQIIVELRERAKADGLWNLFLPDERYGPGLTNWEYGMLCEPWAAARSRPWSSTARLPTPATWRSWPSTARRN